MEGFKRPVSIKYMGQQHLDINGRPHSGFSGDRTVETYQTNQPLQGGVPAPAFILDMSDAMVRKYIAFLQLFPETEVIFQRLNRFIADTLDRFKKLGIGVAHDLHLELRSHCEEAEAALQHTAFCKDTRLQQHVVLVFECYCMEQLHDLCIEWQKRCQVNFTNRLRQALLYFHSEDRMRKTFPCKFEFDIEKAYEALATILKGQLKTPVSKIQGLAAAFQALQDSASEKWLKRHGSLGKCLGCFTCMHAPPPPPSALPVDGVQFGSDIGVDLISLLLIRCNRDKEIDVAQLFAHIAYIHKYNLAQTFDSREGYAAITFEAAMDFIVKKYSALTGQGEGGQAQRGDEEERKGDL